MINNWKNYFYLYLLVVLTNLNANNYIMVIFGDKDSCATILNNFENVEYYERTDKLE